MLADNKRTVEFLLEIAGGDRERMEEVIEWGKRRQARIEALCRFAGLLEGTGVLERDGERLERVLSDHVTMQCLAIATKYGLDAMGYEFSDSQSGPISAHMCLDLEAVTPVSPGSPSGLFGSAGNERRFLEAIGGKDMHELGRMARGIVIGERRRIYG